MCLEANSRSEAPAGEGTVPPGVAQAVDPPRRTGHHKGSSGAGPRGTPRGRDGREQGSARTHPVSPSATHFVVLFKNLSLSLKASQMPPFPSPLPLRYARGCLWLSGE